MGQINEKNAIMDIRMIVIMINKATLGSVKRNGVCKDQYHHMYNYHFDEFFKSCLSLSVRTHSADN